MKKSGINKKLPAVISALILLAAMIPGNVSAASYVFAPDETRLVKTVLRDPDGNVVNVSTYNEKENILTSEDFMPQDQSFSNREYYTYDDTGEVLQEYRNYRNEVMVEKKTYEYEEHNLPVKICTWDQDGGLSLTEEYIYNGSGDPIRIEGNLSDGSYYIIVNEYDDSGRQINSSETSKYDGKTSVWFTYYTYQEIDEYSWSVTTNMYDGEDNLVLSYTESYHYGENGNLLSSVEYEDGNLFSNTFTYDSQDLLVHMEKRPDGEPETNKYIFDYSYRTDRKLQNEIFKYGGDTYTTDYYYTLKPFSDVIDTEYFSLPVKWAVDLGITSGTSPTEFSPYEGCTRGQAVTFLWRASGSPEPSSAVNPFKDVSPTDYYYRAVLWAVESGITNGVSADRFGPDQVCNRGQIVTFLYRAKGEPGIGGTVEFSDVHEGDYFYGAVLWAVADQVTNGTSETTFSPEAECTRGQIVTFLFRALTVG